MHGANACVWFLRAELARHHPEQCAFGLGTPDLRPAMILDHVEDVAINGLSAEGNTESECALRFMNTQKVQITARRVLKQAKVFLQVERQGSSAIIVDGGDLSAAESALAFKGGAQKASVTLKRN